MIRRVRWASRVWLPLLLLPPALCSAETAWIKDEVKLNLRTGPGVQYRILGAVGTGDRVEVVELTPGWTRVTAPATA